MYKIILLTLLLLAGCHKNQNQKLILAVAKCDKAELRAIGLHDLEGKYYIQCRPHIKE